MKYILTHICKKYTYAERITKLDIFILVKNNYLRKSYEYYLTVDALSGCCACNCGLSTPASTSCFNTACIIAKDGKKPSSGITNVWVGFSCDF
jgi:hypothetical protein